MSLGMILAYSVCVGFVSAGVLGSFYQLVTSKPPRFSVSYDSWIGGFTGLFLCGFAGPFIIMRNALNGRRVENRAIGWLFASAAVASGWSLCSGILVLDLALALRETLTTL